VICGAAAEQEALRWLLERGLVFVERNYRCRGGEIDLIMREQHSLVFVEVRARAQASTVSAIDSVGAAKQRRLAHAVRHYLASHPAAAELYLRVDLLAYDGRQWRWLRNIMEFA
jgi:putative endonuclease